VEVAVDVAEVEDRVDGGGVECEERVGCGSVHDGGSGARLGDDVDTGLVSQLVREFGAEACGVVVAAVADDVCADELFVEASGDRGFRRCGEDRDESDQCDTDHQ